MNIDLTNVPKWADIFEVCSEWERKSICGGPFAPFGGGYRVIGPTYYRFQCKKCKSIFDEYDVAGDIKCPSCGFVG